MHKVIDTVLAADLEPGDVILTDTGYVTVSDVEDAEGDTETVLVSFVDQFEDTDTEPFHVFRKVDLFMEVDDDA